MKNARFVGLCSLFAIMTIPSSVEAKGCLRGAVAGGVAGHYAGHHAVVGAVGGCIAARAYYKHKAQQVAKPKAAATAH